MAAAKRATNTYKPGDLFESPLTPAAGFVLHSSFSSSNPAVRSMSKCNAISDVLKVFDLDDRIEHIHKHIAPVMQRQDPCFWQQRDSSSARCTISIVCEIIQCVCSIFCANNAAATTELMQCVMDGEDNQSKSQPDKLLSTIGECYMTAQKGSCEKRVLRAVMCQFPRRSLVEFFAAETTFSLSPESFAQGRKDLNLLRVGTTVAKMVRQVQRFDEETVNHVVKFILSGTNVSCLSWGTKRAKIDGMWVILPAITRRKTPTRMFDAYTLSIPSRLKPLSRATFFRVVNRITARDADMRKAVDYVVGFLVNDTARMLKRLVISMVAPKEDEESLLADVEVVQSYLKCGFDERVRSNVPCRLHDIKYALGHTFEECSPEGDACDDCVNVFAFFERMRTALMAAGAPESASQALDECEHKARLYLGHRLRVLNQQCAIHQATEDLKQATLQNKATKDAIVLIDFKMKLEPLYYREKTVEHYGKRGMTWHGALVQYYNYKEGQDGCEPEVIDQKLYYDHLSTWDNKQDRECVLSMIEAVIIRLRKDLPEVTRIVLQSDNAPSYQNMLLPTLLPYISAKHGVEIVRFLHTETQDGKSILDAHFARSMAALRSWVKEGNDCTTPVQAAIGLSANGGLPNIVVELVEHDREQLKRFVAMGATLEKCLKTHATRANDIKIMIHPTGRISQPTDFQSCPPFTLQIFQYSGIGDGVSLLCDPATGHCTPQVAPRSAIEDSDYTLVMGSIEALREEDVLDGEEDGDTLNDEEFPEENQTDQRIEQIDLDIRSGPATGVVVSTQGQLRRRVMNVTKSKRSVARDAAQITEAHILASATRLVVDMNVEGNIFTQDVTRKFSIRNCATEFDSKSFAARFDLGWAVRPKRGAMYGLRFIAGFRDQIREMFYRGVADNAKKMGPAKMLEELQRRHPDRFDLPTENEIRQEISKLHQHDKQARDLAATPVCEVAGIIVAVSEQQEPADEARGHQTTPTQNRRGGHHPQTKQFADFFSKLLQQSCTVKPNVALQAFKSHFENHGQTDDWIKRKFQNTRASLKRKRTPDE